MKRSELKELLARAGIQPSKGKGQNFLVEDSLAEAIVRDAEVDPQGAVWEVGAGLCVLTLPLARAAAQVLTVELDAKVAELARELLAPHPHVRLIEGDVLATKHSLNPEVLAGLQALDAERLYFVANLPYAVATPLVIRALAAPLPALTRIVVMVQLEFAERAVAGPGDDAYGAVSVLIRALTSEARILRQVPRTVFHPRPKVTSAILSLTPSPTRLEGFAQLEPAVRALFPYRRKSLSNAVKHASTREPSLAWLPDALAASELDPAQRLETLDVADFRRLVAAGT